MRQQIKDFPNKALMGLTIFSSILLTTAQAFEWTLIDLLTPFIAPFLLIILWVLFIFTFIWALRYSVYNQSRLGKIASLPLKISVVTLLICIFVPFTNIAIEINWMRNYDDRVKIVQMIQNGEFDNQITPAGARGESLVLPNAYKHVSDDGKILIQRNRYRMVIFFFTFTGVLDHFSGFAYVSDNQGILTQDFAGRFKQSKKFEDYWFFGASY